MTGQQIRTAVLQCILAIVLGLVIWRPADAHTVRRLPTSLEAKIGQMLIVGFRGTQVNLTDQVTLDILTGRIGGVVLYDHDHASNRNGRNVENPLQLRRLTSQLQRYACLADSNSQSQIFPLFIAVDYEGGKVVTLTESSGFPSTHSAAELGAGNSNAARHAARTMATTLQQLGVNLNFGPVVDVNVNPENPIIAKYGRSFSSVPDSVAARARQFAAAYRRQGVLCTFKHFPGHGSSASDSHNGLTDITSTFRESELVPYRKLIDERSSCPLVMTGHLVDLHLDHDGYPASLSYAMTTDLLRNTLHFEGAVVTDDLQMQAIAQSYDLGTAAQLAINAGADILLIANQAVADPVDVRALVGTIARAVKEGNIPERRIDDAFSHVTKLKRAIAARACRPA